MTDVFTMRATGGGAAGKVDRAEVKRAAMVLFDPDLGVQIQGLPSGRWRIVNGNDLDGIIQAAEWLADEKGVYYSVNPCPVGRDKAVVDKCMVSRRWLFVDVDAKREPDTNSTDDEHEAARDIAYRIMDYTEELGWPLPVIIDSGNGWHLLYRIDLPNDALSKEIVKAVLVTLAEVYNTPQAEVDLKPHNAARISKLPGTMVRKGPQSDERPWRVARLVFVPDTMAIVSAEQLQAIITNGQTLPEAIVPIAAKTDSFMVHANGVDDAGRQRAYARTALEREVAKVCLAPNGQRNDTLNKAAFSMGTLVGAGWILEQEVKEALFLAATRAGLSEHETKGTIRSGLESGKLKPREPLKPKPDGTSQSKAATPKPLPDGPLILRASKVVPRKVEWLWPGRIPLGKMTTFAGRGGLGKTFVLLDIASRVSRGLDWPDSAGVCSDRGQVLFISGEDDPDDTLVPRLMAMGADLDRIAFLSVAAQDHFTLKALDLLAQAVKEIGSDTRLVVIDPPTSYLAGADDHKNAELRTLLTPLKEWAARARVAVVFNTHVNKATGTKVDAASRIIGSVAWANAVRAAHMFSDDPDDDGRSLFCPVKLNVGRKRKGLAYRIKSEDEGADDGPATVEWLGEVDTTADQAVNKIARSQKREIVAADWLLERFRERLEWPSDELFRAAREAGVSKNAIFDAKKTMNLPRARQRVSESGDRIFLWWVPDDWPGLTVPAC